MTRTRIWQGFCFLALFLLGSCASGPKAAPPTSDMTGFHILESRLLESRWVHFGFEITSTGAATAHMNGDLWVGNRGESRLSFVGRFDGKPIHVDLSSDGATLQQHSGEPWKRACPPALPKAYILGFTRMGLLHNIAMAIFGKAPDHGMGDVASWVQVTNVRGLNENQGFTFGVKVDGRNAAEGTLILDPANSWLPAERLQTVEFGAGQVMKVREQYFMFSTTDVPPEALFEIH